MIQVVAIVGSRAFPNLRKVRDFVLRLPDDTEVITGDGRGVEATVVSAARQRRMPYMVFPANWTRNGKRAGPLRNSIIVSRAHLVVAFWDGKSNGTRTSIELATKLGKPLTVITA